MSMPCAAHRLNLCVNDILNETKIKNAVVNNCEQYSVKKFNDEGELKTTKISHEEKKKIERANEVKLFYSKLIAKCRHLVGSFRHSSILTSKLKERQITLNYENKTKLIQDVPTRWNSSYDMLESVLYNKEALQSLALEPENKIIKDYVPSETEFNIIDEFCELLCPMKKLTVLLSGQNYCTISLLYPTIYKLLNYELQSINLTFTQSCVLRE